MREKLEIYACTGLSDNADEIRNGEEYELFTDGTPDYEKTYAQNFILSKLNLLAVEINYTNLSDEQKREKLNDIDTLSLIYICLENAKEGDDVALRVCHTLQENPLLQSLSVEEHNLFLEKIISFANASQTKDLLKTEEGEKLRQTPLYNYIKTELESINTPAYSTAEREYAKEFFAKNEKVGANVSRYDVEKMIYESGCYYMYTFFTEEEAKKAGVYFWARRKKELEMLNYIYKKFLPDGADAGIIANKEQIQNLIRTRATSYYKMSPEEFVRLTLESQDKNEIMKLGDGGLSEAAILAIIYAVVAIIQATVTIVEMCINYQVQKVEAKYAVPENFEYGQPRGEDYLLWEEEEKKKKRKNYLLIGGAILLFFILFSGGKKRR